MERLLPDGDAWRWNTGLLWENCDDVLNLKLLKIKNTWNGVIPVPDPLKSASCGFPMFSYVCLVPAQRRNVDAEKRLGPASMPAEDP